MNKNYLDPAGRLVRICSRSGPIKFSDILLVGYRMMDVNVYR